MNSAMAVYSSEFSRKDRCRISVVVRRNLVIDRVGESHSVASFKTVLEAERCVTTV